jgi:hypothetical protein
MVKFMEYKYYEAIIEMFRRNHSQNPAKNDPTFVLNFKQRKFH